MSDSTRSGIVVGVDGSPASEAAASWAAREAVLRHIPLTLVHTINLFAGSWPELPHVEEVAMWQEDAGRRILDDALKIAVDSMQGGRPIPVDSELVCARTAPTLIDLSRSAEFVVVGDRGRGALARNVLGSVSTNLVRHAHCPIAVVKDAAAPTSDSASPVLLGVDGSPASELATAIAFDEASRRNAPLIAIHAWSDLIMQEMPALDWSSFKAEEQHCLAERLAGWQERYPDVNVRREVVCDRPAHAIVERSKSAQLAVIGSHGRGAVSRALLGSVSNAVLQAVQIPVIIAHSANDEIHTERRTVD